MLVSDEEGEISPERTRALVEYFIDKGVQGLLCQRPVRANVSTRAWPTESNFEEVMKVAMGKLTIIAHVVRNNTMGQYRVGKTCGGSRS